MDQFFPPLQMLHTKQPKDELEDEIAVQNENDHSNHIENGNDAEKGIHPQNEKHTKNG